MPWQARKLEVPGRIVVLLQRIEATAERKDELAEVEDKILAVAQQRLLGLAQLFVRIRRERAVRGQGPCQLQGLC